MEGIPKRGSSASPPHFFDNRSELIWTPHARRIQLDAPALETLEDLKARFGEAIHPTEYTADMLTVWVSKDSIREVLLHLKHSSVHRFERLEDFTAIDETARREREKGSDFTLVYCLLCFAPPLRIRLKVALQGEYPEAPSICSIWPGANWYEREIYDMFGIRFPDHPNLKRLIMPPAWQGHPLRKSHPDRATDMPPYTEKDARELQPRGGETYFPDDSSEDTMILNIGPHHTATHGLFRIIVRLDGEIITGLDLDIGYHHRAVEKLGERQTWLQFVPYADRVDYLAGAANELPYVLAVEQIAAIDVPPRAQYIRVLMSELFRLSNHLSYLGIMGHDMGAMTPNFYTFRERERVLDIVELISGGRLHPAWFRLGGVAMDLPKDWKSPIEALLKVFPSKIKEYEALTLKNPIFRARTKGVGILTLQQAIDWGVTGPNLRSCGLDWDLRKKMPYSGYDQFEFEVPTGTDGDSYTRYQMRMEELRQSLRIIEQVANRMPEGRYVTEDYRYAVPARKDMLNDIESLIHHFVNVTRGPAIPKGEAYVACEIPRGEQGYYVVSDGLGSAYRMHIRGPSFNNVQVFPLLAKGSSIADLVSVLGSTDYTIPDIDR
jgi:NADH-quinone oxidoreductase subunit B/C/D